MYKQLSSIVCFPTSCFYFFKTIVSLSALSGTLTNRSIFRGNVFKKVSGDTIYLRNNPATGYQRHLGGNFASDDDVNTGMLIPSETE